MKNIIKNITTDIREEAAAWCVSLQAEEPGFLERKRFTEWLLRSPQHVQAYLEMAEVWKLASVMQPGRDLDIEAIIEQAQQEKNIVHLSAKSAPGKDNKNSVFFRPWTKVASFVLLIGFVALIFFYVPGSSDADNEYHTGKGEQLSFVLADGSVVQLNTQSRLKVKMFAGTRQVALLEGEAYFDVAHDGKRPFIVRSEDAVVRVLGTKFNVDREKAETTITVVEGKVSVSAKIQSGKVKLDEIAREQLADSLEDRTTVQLLPGEQTTVRSGERELKRNTTSIDKVIAWRERRLVFESELLLDVVREFNRYNSLSIKIVDKRLANIRISGVFDANDPESLLDYLQQYEKVKVKYIDSNKRHLLAELE